MKTIKLDDGKYEFDLDESGCMVAARRHGEDWPVGMNFRFQNSFMAALDRICELENENE